MTNPVVTPVTGVRASASASASTPAPTATPTSPFDLLPQVLSTIEALVVRTQVTCPPAPQNAPASPCPPPSWWLVEDMTPHARRVALLPKSAHLASGARYRMIVYPLPGKEVVVDTTLARTTPLPTGEHDDCEACIAHTLEWGETAQLAPNTIYELRACRALTSHEYGSDHPRTCTSTLACSMHDDLARIEVALRHPDVVRALASAPVKVGVDARAADGVMFRIAVDGKELLVGPACDARPGCKPVPPGLADLAKLLHPLNLTTDGEACELPRVAPP